MAYSRGTVADTVDILTITDMATVSHQDLAVVHRFQLD